MPAKADAVVRATTLNDNLRGTKGAAKLRPVPRTSTGNIVIVDSMTSFVEKFSFLQGIHCMAPEMNCRWWKGRTW